MPASRSLQALVLIVGILGAGVIVRAIGGLPALSAPQAASMAVLAFLTMVSGGFAIKIPGRSATISVSEVFVFVAILLLGPGPASLIVAVDGLLVSFRQKRWVLYRTVFNVAEPAVSVACAGAVFQAVSRMPLPPAPLVPHLTGFLGTLAMAGTFFVLNSGLTALAVGLEGGSSSIDVWKGHAMSLAINFYAAASLAALAVPNRQALNLEAVGLIVPLLVLSYVAYREAARRVDDAEGHASEVQHLYEETRKRDEALRQGQKMEAIGRLAGGVAHDFNNMLTAIRGYAEMTLESLPAEDPLKIDVNEIVKAADRAAALNRQLLAFSRRSIIAPRIVRLDQVVTSMDSMLRRLLGEDVVLVTSIGPDVLPVRIDPNELEQVLLNLAVNARDAMPDGGTLRITLANATIGGDGPTHVTLASGNYVELSVADTGSGMTEEVMSHVFEPFFTTKPEGRGTGLGLATVYGVIEKAGGTITIDSQLGGGTTFRVLLPASGETVSALEEARPSALVRGTATVLLVEDEPAVAALITTALQRAGYSLHIAIDASQALQIARAHPSTFDLLLTDVVMPGMSGRELSDRIVQYQDRVRVLFMSGYSDDTVIQRGVESSTVAFIQKPFSMEALTSKIREVLCVDPVGV